MTVTKQKETRMSAREMTIFGIVFLILAILAQEYLLKISEPIIELVGCRDEDATQITIRGTTIPYAISVLFLLFPRLIRAFEKWKEWRKH